MIKILNLCDKLILICVLQIIRLVEPTLGLVKAIFAPGALSRFLLKVTALQKVG